MVASIRGLVWSRIRFDWKRHVTALAAVAILMGSFLTFNAVAAGMHSALEEEIRDEGHSRIQLSTGGFAPTDAPASLDIARLASLDGVESVSPRSAKATGIEVEMRTFGPNGTRAMFGSFDNFTSELVLVGIDAAAEAVLVEPAPEMTSAVTTTIFRGRTATNYSLLSGSWIRGPGEAVATQSAADAGYGIGANFTVEGTRYHVVGVIGSFHPANLNVPGVFPAGHLLVDRAGQTWPTTGGAFLQLRPEFQAIQSVTETLVSEYPFQTGGLQAALADLERQFYEGSRTQQVLSAAARLVGLAGAATVFAMSLFLLIGERRAIGTLASLGFSRGRLASYMTQKMVYVAVLGSVAGGGIGWLVVQAIDVPTVSFDTQPTIDAFTYGFATLETLAAALLGSFAAFALTIRKDPVEALAAD